MSMNVTITSETISECQDFLHIIYDDKKYLLEEFAKEYKTNDFSLDKKLKESTIVYRGKRMTYDEFCKANHDFGEELKFVDRYNKEIYPLEYLLIMRNSDYYKAAKYIKKTEQCFQTARYYLLNSYDLLKTDFEVNWSSGYVPQFLLRTMDFTTAVVWYNSCFDYILQVAYFAFGIYKKTDEYTDQTSHEDLLKKCTYDTMGKIYSQYKTVPNYKALWEIIIKCYNALSEINSWANYIKHKGGISFKGLNPPEPFHMSMTDTKGNIVAESSNFESIEIDLDDSLLVLKDVHKAIYDCINSLIDFIDFNSAQSPKVILP
ncbi:hypothetical protein [Caproicibacterium sp. BJN0003]|uniref:hypothetical protein n=1 Tax=Caproicibacterium sp. BJN0003 TaxID=2994078 RepID=UPI00225B9E4A|nr:hypothetical protein [Caproicibacterium sp. BJN0003]UZT82621.1 hypothetical protein OP489_02080 [Caproicibacterium sp. BJN0003]